MVVSSPKSGVAIHVNLDIFAVMIQKLRELLEADPFRAFTVALADGRRFDVPSPDLVWMPAEGRGGLHFFLPAEDRIVSVNLMLVASVEWAAGGQPA
jgi:hypothetical protein